MWTFAAETCQQNLPKCCLLDPRQGGNILAKKKEEYLYLSAMLRAREPKLLNRDKAERMLDASTFEEAARILTDCGYEDMSQMNAEQIDETLAKHRAEIFAELERIAADKNVVDVFKLKYDYHNAKAIIKGEAMNVDAEYLLSDSGRIKGEELLTAYHEERYNVLPEIFAGAVREAKTTLAHSANPQMADFVLDRAYFREMAKAAEAADSQFLTGYVQTLIDTANLKSAVRSMRMHKNAEFLTEVLIPDGGIGTERILNAGDRDNLAALYAHTVLEKAAALGAQAAEGGKMTEFELACDNAVTAYLGNAKLVSYGEEPVVAYLAAVENEITAIRMILTSRLAGIAPDSIRERLRDFYA